MWPTKADQPAFPLSLIGAFVVPINKASIDPWLFLEKYSWLLKYIFIGLRTGKRFGFFVEKIYLIDMKIIIF